MGQVDTGSWFLVHPPFFFFLSSLLFPLLAVMKLIPPRHHSGYLPLDCRIFSLYLFYVTSARFAECILFDRESSLVASD